MTAPWLFLAATTILAAWVITGAWVTRRRHQPPPTQPVGLGWIPDPPPPRGRYITLTDDSDRTQSLPMPEDPDYWTGPR